MNNDNKTRSNVFEDIEFEIRDCDRMKKEYFFVSRYLPVTKKKKPELQNEIYEHSDNYELLITKN